MLGSKGWEKRAAARARGEEKVLLRTSWLLGLYRHLTASSNIYYIYIPNCLLSNGWLNWELCDDYGN